MKTTKLRITALMALASAVLNTGAAQAAAPNPPSNDGDIFFGVRATDGTGSSSDYLVDLGPATAFTAVAPNGTLSLGNYGTDLSNTFGTAGNTSDWYTRLDGSAGTNAGNRAVLWSLIGDQTFAGNGDPDNTLYASNPSANTPWSRGSDSAQANITSLIDQMKSTYDSASTTTANPRATVQSTGGTSYASYQKGGGNSGGISFQQFNPTNEGTPNAKLTFDRIVSSSTPNLPSKNLGTVTLSPTGALTFTAVPEPSTYASMLLGAGLLFVLMKRKNRAARLNAAR